MEFNEREEIVKLIDDLLKYSEYFFYPDEKEYKKSVKKLQKLKKLLKSNKINRYVKGGINDA